MGDNIIILGVILFIVLINFIMFFVVVGFVGFFIGFIWGGS